MRNPPEDKAQTISEQEMERKLLKVDLSLYRRVAIKSTPNRIVVHKREKGYRYEELNGDTKAIIYTYVGADGTERKSTRLLVADDITFIVEAAVGVPEEEKSGTMGADEDPACH